jgi:hypothetical protein
MLSSARLKGLRIHLPFTSSPAVLQSSLNVEMGLDHVTVLVICGWPQRRKLTQQSHSHIESSPNSWECAERSRSIFLNPAALETRNDVTPFRNSSLDLWSI